MIDGKTLAKAVIWHQLKIWTIPVLIWLGASYYFASHQMPIVAEVILWSPGLLIVMFQHDYTAVDRRARADADRDVQRVIDDIKNRDPDRFKSRRREIIYALLNAKCDLADLGHHEIADAIDKQVAILQAELVEERKVA